MDAFEDLADFAEEEDAIDALAPAIAAVAIRHGMKRAAAALPHAQRKQLVKTVTAATRHLVHKHGPHAVHALPAIVTHARRIAQRKHLSARHLPHLVSRGVRAATRSPHLLRRLAGARTRHGHAGGRAGHPGGHVGRRGRWGTGTGTGVGRRHRRHGMTHGQGVGRGHAHRGTAGGRCRGLRQLRPSPQLAVRRAGSAHRRTDLNRPAREG